VSAWHIAGLIAAPFAAWYLQWLVRWGAGPFGVLDALRGWVFGVVVLDDVEGKFYHQPIRRRLVGGILGCARCTLFWVVLAASAGWWFAPWAVVAFGVMGAASLLDNGVTAR